MKIDFRLELRALDSDDAPVVRAWRNSWAVWAWTRQNDLISDVEQLAWFDKQSKDPTIRMYGISLVTGAYKNLVGVAGLTSIDWPNRRSEFSLYINPEQHRKGYGKQALSMLLDHGFKNLGLHQIYGETFAGNPAIKIFTELGFKLDGTRRQFYFKDGAFRDAHLVSLLQGEWNARNSASSVNRDSHPGESRASDSPEGQACPKRVARRSKAARGSADVLDLVPAYRPPQPQAPSDH